MHELSPFRRALDEPNLSKTHCALLEGDAPLVNGRRVSQGCICLAID